jgi:antitoxin component YwqK of YwqJK toxin-antitoxin module
MKPTLLLLLVISFNSLHAQEVPAITYYNRKGDEVNADKAFRYGEVTKQQDHYRKLLKFKKGDILISEEYFLDKECKNQDGAYRTFYNNGKLSASGAYDHGKKTGLWKSWTTTGVLIDSAVYKNDFIYGLNLSWNSDGNIIDSSLFEENGKGTSHGYWPNGIRKHQGGYANGKKEGHWIYYYKNGNKCQEVNYAADSALNYSCYDEQGKLQEKDCIYELEAGYPGGETAWMRWLVGQLSNAKLPNDYYKGKIYGELWIQFIVDSDGTIMNVEVKEPLDARLDKIAVHVIKNSPRWKNAVQYNRPVKAYRLQPITFPKME